MYAMVLFEVLFVSDDWQDLSRPKIYLVERAAKSAPHNYSTMTGQICH
jgi:hypothetical protein